MEDRSKPVLEGWPTRPAEQRSSGNRKQSDALHKDYAGDQPGQSRLGGILRELDEQQRHLD